MIRLIHWSDGVGRFFTLFHATCVWCECVFLISLCLFYLFADFSSWYVLRKRWKCFLVLHFGFAVYMPASVSVSTVPTTFRVNKKLRSDYVIARHLDADGWTPMWISASLIFHILFLRNHWGIPLLLPVKLPGILIIKLDWCFPHALQKHCQHCL